MFYSICLGKWRDDEGGDDEQPSQRAKHEPHKA